MTGWISHIGTALAILPLEVETRQELLPTYSSPTELHRGCLAYGQRPLLPLFPPPDDNVTAAMRRPLTTPNSSCSPVVPDEDLRSPLYLPVIL